MEKKVDAHVFAGMQKDMAISKHKNEFLYDAYNIRFTPMEGNTMLSITNERGPKYQLTCSGKYVGHCVIDKYLVIFTKSADQSSLTPDRIVRYEPNNDNDYNETVLYEGNLDFDLSYPLETLGVYENENVIKVYWVDGIHQPRVINIIDPEQRIQQRAAEYPEIETQFDFVRTLNLEETVNITRLNGNGQFNPGTVQYAFSYYTLYGQQSCIFYTSPLQYISFSDRGASPEDKVSNVFSIQIGNIDVESFDYLRVYSIQRTDSNGPFTARRVVDLKTSKAEYDSVLGYTITFIDDGTIGEAIDAKELYYIGGEEITANTMCTKDNTMFFGDLTLTRREVPSTISDRIAADSSLIDTYTSYSVLNLFGNKYYSYINCLDKVKPGFKTHEHYKFGLQFQHKTGKWSAPIVIGVHTIENRPQFLIVDGTASLSLPSVELTHTFTSEELNTLYNLGYKRVRGVCVFPDITERLVLTQGMLCPTVYNYMLRKQNAPYACSSWFFRPSFQNSYKIDGDYDVNGNIAEFRHMNPLPADTERNAEVQGALGQDGNTPGSEELTKEWYVDQSIVTMHSPEVEFDDRFHNLNDYNYRLDIVGYVPFNSNLSSIDIEVSTPGAGTPRIFTRSYSSREGGKSLIAGTFWNDGIVIKTTNGYEFFKDNGNIIFTNYLVYPWQRTGSLNNDINRNDESTRTAILKRKRLSNLKFSEDTVFFQSNISTPKYDITVPQLFSSDELSLIKIKNPSRGVYDENDIHYYGNMYTTLEGEISPKITVTGNGDISSDSQDAVASLEDKESDISGLIEELAVESGPVDIRYKSTPHLVMGLLSNSTTGHLNILPRLFGFPDDSGSKEAFWHNDVPNDAIEFKYAYLNLNDAETDVHTNPDIPVGVFGIILVSDGLRVYDREYVPTGPSAYQIVLTPVDAYGKKYYYTYHHTNGPETVCYEGRVSGSNVVSVVTDTTISTSEEVDQELISVQTESSNLLLIGELIRDELPTDFNNEDPLWLPVGEPKELTQQIRIPFTQGDTWYQRYDCLKTYAYSEEQLNNVVEIGSFMCETRVNIDGRYDKNRGLLNNLNISPTNFNLINHSYTVANDFFGYRKLDERFKELDDFPNQITWTLDKWMGNEIDLWTNITLANTLDVDGVSGRIRALRLYNDNILCFQDNAISQVLFNSRVQIPTTDGIPIEIANSGKMDGKRTISDTIGCSNKWSIKNTPNALYFLDSNSKKLYAFTDKLQTISDTHGFDHHFKSIEHFDSEKTFYDPIRQDLYLVWDKQCLVWSELLGQFTSFMSYEGVPAMFSIGDTFYCLHYTNVWRDDQWVQVDSGILLYKMFAGAYNRFFGYDYKPVRLIFISNPEGSTDKIFSTLGARLDIFQEPIYDNGNWDTSSSTGEPEESERYLFNPKHLEYDAFFDYIRVTNEYQDTGEVILPQSWFAPASHGFNKDYNPKKKFRMWRVDIPRDKDRKLDRIRNTWAKIELGFIPPVMSSNSPSDQTLLDYASSHGITDFSIDLYREGLYEESGLAGYYTEHHSRSTPSSLTDAQKQYYRKHLVLHDLDVQYFI